VDVPCLFYDDESTGNGCHWRLSISDVIWLQARQIAGNPSGGRRPVNCV
jgi:hypothetical protein